MGRLVAYVANDPDRVACALYAGRRQLVAVPEAGAPPFDSWGIGFHQGGEVLLQRRPKQPTEPLDFYQAARELRTDAFIAHARVGTVGKPKNENTHPFRFRSWLFAHHGTLPDWNAIAAPLVERIPDFLRRNIRGQTDSEHLFHLVLSFLHEANKLDDPNVSTATVRAAVGGALGVVAELAGAEAARASECALAMSNGSILVATRNGRPVLLARTQSVLDCPVCRETAPPSGKPPKRVDHEHLRSVCLIADTSGPTAAPWQEVPDRTFVSVNAELSVEQHPI
jgi:glutamine amidotransferase